MSTTPPTVIPAKAGIPTPTVIPAYAGTPGRSLGSGPRAGSGGPAVPAGRIRQDDRGWGLEVLP